MESKGGEPKSAGKHLHRNSLAGCRRDFKEIARFGIRGPVDRNRRHERLRGLQGLVVAGLGDGRQIVIEQQVVNDPGLAHANADTSGTSAGIVSR